MGPRAGLDRCGKSRHTGIRSLNRPARSAVAIPAELPGSRGYIVNITKWLVFLKHYIKSNLNLLYVSIN